MAFPQKNILGFDLSAKKIPTKVPREGILINATSLGLNTNDFSPIDLSLFSERLKVFDMIYNPSATELLKAARSQGMKYSNGLAMLVGQGARSLESWLGLKQVPVDVMYSAAKQALG